MSEAKKGGKQGPKHKKVAAVPKTAASNTALQNAPAKGRKEEPPEFKPQAKAEAAAPPRAAAVSASAGAASAAKSGRVDALWVVMSCTHTDCYKRADSSAKVEGVYSNEAAAQRHCLELNLLELTEYDGEAECRQVRGLLKAWWPHKGPEVEIKTKDEDEEESGGEEGGFEREAVTAAVQLVPADKLAPLYKKSVQLLRARRGEFTMQASGTVWTVTRQGVRDAWRGKKQQKKRPRDSDDEDEADAGEEQKKPSGKPASSAAASAQSKSC